jgi:IS5 family transposase
MKPFPNRTSRRVGRQRVPQAGTFPTAVFSKNRERLLAGEVAQAFFDQVLAQARKRELLSDDHFTVDGTLSEAWAGQKRLQRKEAASPSPPPDDPGHPSIDFRGERRTNATHASTTDPEARLYKKAKGQEAKLVYLGHVLMENRHGLVVDTRVTQATGTAEREAALVMAEGIPGQQRVTLGADKNYDTRDGVRELRELRVTPHVAQNTSGRSSAIDERTTRHPGYAVSQRKRKCVEEIFGWLKTVGLLRKVRHRGVARVGWMFTFAAAVYNVVRIARWRQRHERNGRQGCSASAPLCRPCSHGKFTVVRSSKNPPVIPPGFSLASLSSFEIVFQQPARRYDLHL